MQNTIKFTYLTDEDRKKLPLEDFGDPNRRLFPLITQEDVDKAPHRVSALTNLEEVKNRIIDIANRKGFLLPVNWMSETKEIEHSMFSVKNEKSDAIAEFELDSSTAKDTNDGEYILRTGKIFEAGQYPDKKFEITPEELCEAIADFAPVDLDLEHMPTILDGKLGKLEAVALGADGWSLIGTVRLPKWLDKQLGEAERKVSATWDRATKKLTKLALVRNPRVKDAALMAAFMANEFSDQIEGATESDLAKTIETLMEAKFGKKTWDGISLMQGIHDMAARSGAVCYDDQQKFSEAEVEGFVSSAEAKLIQQIHDAALRGSAKCTFLKERSGTEASSNYTKENNKMTLEDVKSFFKSMPDSEDGKVNTELNAEEIAKEIKTAAETAANAAVEAFKSELKAEEEAKAATLAAELEVAEVEEEKESKVEDKVEHSAVEPTDREKALEAQIEELKQKDISREAEKFADTEIKTGRAFPAERATLIALFSQATNDDNASEVKVAFKQGEENVEVSRVEAIKALYSVRNPHNMTYDDIEDLNLNVLAVYNEEDSDYLGDAEKQAKEYASKKKASGKGNY